MTFGVNISSPSIVFGYILVPVCPIGMAVSIGCFIFTIQELKINPCIKKILVGMTVQEAIAFLFLFVLFFLIFAFDQRNWIICELVTLVMGGLMGGTVVLTSITSVIRYYMAYKTSLAKVPNVFQIEMLALLALFGHYLISFLLIFIPSKNQGTCSLDHLKDAVGWPFYLYAIYSGLIQVIGIIADILMILFLKKKNQQVQPPSVSAVPLVSNQEELTHTIPQNGSIITSSLSGFLLIFVIILSFPQEFPSPQWSTLSVTTILHLFLLPIIFLFTIKKRKPATQNLVMIPLQFHEIEAATTAGETSSDIVGNN